MLITDESDYNAKWLVRVQYMQPLLRSFSGYYTIPCVIMLYSYTPVEIGYTA